MKLTESSHFETKTKLSDQRITLLKDIPQNEAPKEREQVQPATEAPLLQKITQANAAIKTIAAMSLEQFWEANPEVAANKVALLQTFGVLRSYVAQTQENDQQLDKELAKLEERNAKELADLDKLEEQRAMQEQQEREKQEVAEQLRNELLAQTQEVERQQEAARQQVAAEQQRVAAATQRDLEIHQELERQKLLSKQAAKDQTSAPAKPPVEPQNIVATSLFDQCKADLEAKAGVGTTIQRLEAQLAQKTRTLEADRTTEMGMELDRAEDQDLKKLRTGR
jgi:colicin import membrane protein